MTWLWLEDNQNSVADINDLLSSANVDFLKFETPHELSAFLFKHKNQLNDYGLLVDVMLENQNFIIYTKELNNTGEDILFPTNRSYDAGIVYVKDVVLNQNTFWDKTPPIIFLTVMGDEETTLTEEVNKIKKTISNKNNISLDSVKVKWLTKWSATLEPDLFLSTIKEFEDS